MSLLHCPLCLSLAALSLLRAFAHLALMGLRLVPGPPLPSAPAGLPLELP